MGNSTRADTYLLELHQAGEIGFMSDCVEISPRSDKRSPIEALTHLRLSLESSLSTKLESMDELIGAIKVHCGLTHRNRKGSYTDSKPSGLVKRRKISHSLSEAK
jgi:hypothetical protein